jgi:hypothetical protein
MTPENWALAIVATAFILALTYALLRLAAERDADRAARKRMRDDAHWASLMHTVQRARWDFNR